MSTRKFQSSGQSPAARITQEIIARLEAGTRPWIKPWRGLPVSRPLRACGTPYRGMNVFWLWMVADMCGYASPFWMTYNQASKLRGQVRKGEKSTIAIFYKSYTKEVESSEPGDVNEGTRRVLKAYPVFNADQIEGLPERFYRRPEPVQVNPEQRIEALERFFRQTKAEIVTGVRASYSPVHDRIEMPPFECFDDAVSYYGTLAHELTHWTAHPSRLSRSFNNKAWGDEGYAKEELVAELGACFLAADLGFEPVVREEHVAYIQCWLKVLKNDKRFIFNAAALAQRAVEFVKLLQWDASGAPEAAPPRVSGAPQPRP